MRIEHLKSFQLQDLEQNWTEPLHEYAQFAEIIKKLLAYRHQKHVQYEMTKLALETKREQMEELDRSEAEAQRLQSALSGNATPGSAFNRRPGTSVLAGESDDPPSANRSQDPRSIPPPSYVPPRRKPTGMGLLNALSYSLHGMMDVDPETARRNSISKTKESISQVSYIFICIIVL